MELRVPEKKAYYYECTATTNRLVYWIPIADLEEMVNTQQVHERVLSDYPDGLDLDVTCEDFTYFGKKYGLVLDFHWADILHAFLSVWLKTNRSARGSGYIEREYLEKIATGLRKEKEKLGIPLPVSPEKPASLRQRKQALTSQAKHNSQLRKLLVEFRAPRIKKNAPLAEQIFAKVEMTEGDDAGKIFSALQQRRKGEASHGDNTRR
jgi:hypothetical protein